MKYFNCPMSSSLFSSFQQNTKCESSFLQIHVRLAYLFLNLALGLDYMLQTNIYVNIEITFAQNYVVKHLYILYSTEKTHKKQCLTSNKAIFLV
jgi:hypothetical protein